MSPFAAALAAAAVLSAPAAALYPFEFGTLGSKFGVPAIPASYDYIVAGGGTAGLALANRLASNCSVSVAVIEAGGFYQLDNGNLSQIPADAVYFIEGMPVVRNPLIDWYQFTTPQFGDAQRSIHYPSGKTLGGSSARNLLWYQRSASTAYQKWADQVDDQSYTLDNLDKYFRHSTSFHPPRRHQGQSNASIKFDAKAYGVPDGPVQVSYPSYLCAISSWVANALTALGLQDVAGFSSGNILGWSFIGETLNLDQTRSSSQTSYLRDSLDNQDNFRLYQSTIVKKVLFDNDKKASGVLVSSGGFEYRINATKEVIISAGTFRSPQLLMVSGIGPKETLDRYGINVLSDRPGVGQNMWDHVLLGPEYAVNVITHSRLTADPAFAATAMDSYNRARQGILTNTGADLLAFEKLPPGKLSESTRRDLDTQFGGNWPDMEFLVFDNALTAPPTDGRNYVNALAGIVAPFSRGNVTIVSNDTAMNPVISPNWLQDPRDQEVAVAGFKRAREIFNTTQLRPVLVPGANGDVEFFPGSNVTSDHDILQAILRTASTIDHAAGTCAMGRRDDRNAVLDSKASVIGVKGLRVVDASAFPLLPPGHPQGTICTSDIEELPFFEVGKANVPIDALAEKIADDIHRASQ